MKTAVKFAGLVILASGLVICGCGKKKFTSWKAVKSPDVSTQLKSFVTQKEAQINSSPGASMSDFAPFFAAAKSGDWQAVNSEFNKLSQHVPSYKHSGTNDLRLRGTQWAAMVEIWGALQAFSQGDQKYPAVYANDIIDSIPPGSIYFGGTDPGRFLITAMQKSQVNGDPFFTLTQNALADGTYLDYLRSMYGDKIYIPTSEDSQNCFNDYYADAKERLQNHQLKPGENVKVDQKGQVQVRGQVAVMEINGLIAKVIFDKNTNQDFYVEESFPLDWMYPYLEPHGLIFKVDHQPLSTLSDDTIQQDQDYWTKTISPMIGDWLDDYTSLSDVAAFNEKVFLHHDFSGFTGDTNFVLSSFAPLTFSKERSAIANLYAWRAKHTDNPSEKDHMARAADFAFHQSWALCPNSPEAVYRYVQFLMDKHRSADALLVAETAAKFRGPYATSQRQIESLVAQLKRQQ